MVRFCKALVLAVTLAASPAMAVTQDEVNATLRADAQVWGGLLALGIAHGISEICPSFEARTFSGRLFLLGLYNRARSLGYSRAQIRDFVEDDAEKARLRTEVLAHFARNGAREDAPDTVCALGRAEIAAGSLAGDYIRAR